MKCDNCKQEKDVEHPRVYLAPIKQWATNKNIKLCKDCLKALQDNVELGYADETQDDQKA